LLSASVLVVQVSLRSIHQPVWEPWSPKAKKNGFSTAKKYIMEEALTADFAFVKAWKGDTHGHLIFRSTARNFNPMMATAGKITIAEVEELVPAGELDANEIHTPGIFVQRVVKATGYEKPIEQRTVRSRD
jgi:3-oxoacid CoA-transferase subunit A